MNVGMGPAVNIEVGIDHPDGTYTTGKRSFLGPGQDCLISLAVEGKSAGTKDPDAAVLRAKYQDVLGNTFETDAIYSKDPTGVMGDGFYNPQITYHAVS